MVEYQKVSVVNGGLTDRIANAVSADAISLTWVAVDTNTTVYTVPAGKDMLMIEAWIWWECGGTARLLEVALEDNKALLRRTATASAYEYDHKTFDQPFRWHPTGDRKWDINLGGTGITVWALISAQLVDEL